MSIATVGCLGWAGPAFAADFSPNIQTGVHLHTGKDGKSLKGLRGYFMSFRAEGNKDAVHPYSAMDLSYTSGLGSIGTDKPTVSTMNFAFHGGFHVMPFRDAPLKPFVGPGIIIGWGYMNVKEPVPSGVDPHAEAIFYGYQLTGGVDIKSGKDRFWRVMGGYYSASGKLAGVSGFQLNGFRISLGLTW